MKSYSDHIAQVSTALADPTRREIMEYVYGSENPLSVREVAEYFGLHANAARMHLDKLVKGGLLRVVRKRGKHGGRPANLYGASEEDLEIHLPPRRYKLLAEILAKGVAGMEEGIAPLAADEAFERGREEAMRSSSPLAYLPRGAGLREVAEAWLEEIERRGLKARLMDIGAGTLEMTFLSCPFGECSRTYPGLVCEIHRRLEEGFLSLAGSWVLKGTDTSCIFHLKEH